MRRVIINEYNVSQIIKDPTQLSRKDWCLIKKKWQKFQKLN